MSAHVADFMVETAKVARLIDKASIERLVDELASFVGTLYLAGLGGSAANCIHAAADFRRLCGIDARAMVENISDLTARANDDGWDSIFSGQLMQFASNQDCLMVLSVGGGTPDVSVPLVRAIGAAREQGMRVYGIVGRDGGYTAQHADVAIVIPTVDEGRVTPHTEAWQMVIVHLLVSHPALQRNRTKW
jgi:D-sedoheptulose 7-phosphate isomerase